MPMKSWFIAAKKKEGSKTFAAICDRCSVEPLARENLHLCRGHGEQWLGKGTPGKKQHLHHLGYHFSKQRIRDRKENVDLFEKFRLENYIFWSHLKDTKCSGWRIGDFTRFSFFSVSLFKECCYERNTSCRPQAICLWLIKPSRRGLHAFGWYDEKLCRRVPVLEKGNRKLHLWYERIDESIYTTGALTLLNCRRAAVRQSIMNVSNLAFDRISAGERVSWGVHGKLLRSSLKVNELPSVVFWVLSDAPEGLYRSAFGQSTDANFNFLHPRNDTHAFFRRIYLALSIAKALQWFYSSVWTGIGCVDIPRRHGYRPNCDSWINNTCTIRSITSCCWIANPLFGAVGAIVVFGNTRTANVDYLACCWSSGGCHSQWSCHQLLRSDWL